MNIINTALCITLTSVFCHSALSQSTATYTESQIQAGRPCYFDLNSDPKLARLLSKVGAIQPEKDYRAPIELLAIKTKPNKDDKVAISYWAKSRQDCDQKAQSYVQSHTSSATLAIRQSAENAFYALLTKLFSGDISFGDFNQSRQELNQTNSIRLKEQAESEKLVRESEKIKRDAEVKAQAIRNEADARRNAENLAKQNQAEVERQEMLRTLLQKHTENANKRESDEGNALLNINCNISSLIGGNCREYNRRANRINDFDETQEIEWVKGNISGRAYIRSVLELHQGLIELDSYQREEYMFNGKVAAASDDGKISVNDARYLMERNSNQIAERKATRQPPSSIPFTCKSESFGGVVTTNCR